MRKIAIRICRNNKRPYRLRMLLMVHFESSGIVPHIYATESFFRDAAGGRKEVPWSDWHEALFKPAAAIFDVQPTIIERETETQYCRKCGERRIYSMTKAVDRAVSRAVYPYSNDLAWTWESDIDRRRKRHSSSVRDIITNPGVHCRQAAKCPTRADNQENVSTNKMLAGKSSWKTLSARVGCSFLE